MTQNVTGKNPTQIKTKPTTTVNNASVSHIRIQSCTGSGWLHHMDSFFGACIADIGCVESPIPAQRYMPLPHPYTHRGPDVLLAPIPPTSSCTRLTAVPPLNEHSTLLVGFPLYCSSPHSPSISQSNLPTWHVPLPLPIRVIFHNLHSSLPFESPFSLIYGLYTAHFSILFLVQPLRKKISIYQRIYIYKTWRDLDAFRPTSLYILLENRVGGGIASLHSYKALPYLLGELILQ